MSLITKKNSPFLWYDIKITADVVIKFGYKSNRFRGSTKTADRKEARLIEAGIRQALMTGTYQEAAQGRTETGLGMTLGSVLRKALPELWSTHKSYKSFYILNTNSICKDSIAELKVHELSTNIINLWMTECLDRGNARSTVNQKLGIIRQCLTRASKVWGLDVPLIEWEELKLKKAGNQHKVFFDDDKMKQIENYLLSHGRRDVLDIVFVLADVGARFSSIQRLHRTQLDLKNRSITLLDTKNGDDITLPLTSRAVEVFARRVDKEYPFQDVTYSMVKAVWQRMRKDFGWPSGEGYKIHALRHTCGTNLAQAGVDIRVIQKWLGHRDIRQTARYTQVLDNQLADARDKLEKGNDGI